MGFIAALSITVGAVILYEKTQMRSIELAVGCLSVAAVALLMTLVLAPWPLQLLLLLGILFSWGRFPDPV